MTTKQYQVNAVRALRDAMKAAAKRQQIVSFEELGWIGYATFKWPNPHEGESNVVDTL